MPRPPVEVTPEKFAAAVQDVRDELASVTPEMRRRMLARDGTYRRPHALRDRIWQDTVISRDLAMELTGYPANSVRSYGAQGNKARREGTETYRHMPAESEGGGWVAGKLVIWMASRNEGRARNRPQRWPAIEDYLDDLREILRDRDPEVDPVTPAEVAETFGVTRHYGARLLREVGAREPRTSDEDAAAFLTALAGKEGRSLTTDGLYAALSIAGLHTGRRRAARLWLDGGGNIPPRPQPSGDTPVAFESTRFDGMLTGADLARSYEVTEGAVTKARKRGFLKGAAKWNRYEQRWLYDPAMLTHRKDKRLGPVAKGHPDAAEPIDLSRYALPILAGKPALTC